MRRTILWAGGARVLTVGVAVLLALMLWVAATALPATMSSNAAFAQASSTVTIDPTEGPAGTTVTGTGTNWQAGDRIQVTWDGGNDVLGNTTVGSDGTFSVSFKVPSNAPEGDHTVYFTDLDSRYFLTATFKVTQSGTGTGGSIDLEVTKIDPLGQSICAGSDVTFRAYIRNNGSNESGFFNIRWIADNTKTFDGGHHSIAAKATDTHDHIWKKLSAGKHTLDFIADFDKQKSESNENNNRSTVTFTADNCSPGTAQAQGYRLPFVGKSSITTGPGCSNTHGKDPQYARSSEAIDFAMPKGTPIYAAKTGRIVSAQSGWNGGFGNLMKVKHDDGNTSWYAHLDSFVKTSGPVNQGDHIANSGTTGKSTGPHLHFEVRNSNNQSIWIRDLPGITWYSGDASKPCQPPGQPDGKAVGPPLR